MMRLACVVVSLFLWLVAAPCRAAEGGIATIVEGDVTLMRGASWLKLVDGVRVQEGDVVEAAASSGVQIELFDGSALGLQGPASLYIATLPARDGKLVGAAEVYLPRGWLKATVHGTKSDLRVRTPLASMAAMDAVVVIRSDNGSYFFIEAGNARLTEPGRKATDASSAASGEFWSRAAAGKPLTSAQRPPPTFLGAMPKNFMVTLPVRLARFQTRRVEPTTLRDATFADAEPWLATPYKAAFVSRFQGRLKDPSLQKAVEPRPREPEPAKAVAPVTAPPPPPPPPAQKGFFERLFERNNTRERERGQ